MDNMLEKRRWSIEQRLEFIEFRLYWDGHLNRADIIEKFGISVPQASADLAAYQMLAPDNIHYHKSRKTYVAADKFRPVLTKPSARHYFSQLRAIEDGIVDHDETWLGQLPPFAAVPEVRRRLDASRLRTLLRAIRESFALQIEYQSFSHPELTVRWITPHALGFDGFRWHARAWCHVHGDFRDFVLARLLTIRRMKEDAIDPQADRAWQVLVTLRLGPHPRMTAGQRRAIELDYGMVDGVAEVMTRVCLSYYLERQLRLDLDPSTLPPERQQIVLLNRDEVESARRALSVENKFEPMSA